MHDCKVLRDTGLRRYIGCKCFGRYAGKLAQAAEDVVSAEVECAQALRSYFKGMLCFACSPDWDQHLVYDASGALVGVEVNQNTCVRIVSECAAVNTAIVAIAGLATSFASDMVDALRRVLLSFVGDFVLLALCLECFCCLLH